MNKVLIYYHIYGINNWLDIVKEQMSLIGSSGLIDNSIIKVGFLYNDQNLDNVVRGFFKQYSNVSVLFSKTNTRHAESETLAVLKDEAMEHSESKNILYIHAKGVTQYGKVREYPVKKWRNMMEYFLIERWRDCIEKMDEGYDCAGINYQDHQADVRGEQVLIKIFNGNFFWANTSYIKKLDKSLLFEHTHSSENWILSSNPRVFSFYNTPVDIDLYSQINDNYKKAQ